jgi:5-methylcytosine-specific restriction endonuclease McrA
VSEILRVYTRPEEIGRDGYPLAWHKCTSCLGDGCTVCGGEGSAKDLVRALAGHRCVRCGHPYRKGEHGKGEWSPCDEQCTHRGPYRYEWLGEGREEVGSEGFVSTAGQVKHLCGLRAVEARWRILTVHHLTMDKADLRWWNLASLCQRCHLQVQGKVQMARVYPWPHSEWFKPYAAGWYAWAYLGEELTREETMARLDELLALELAA